MPASNPGRVLAWWTILMVPLTACSFGAGRPTGLENVRLGMTVGQIRGIFRPGVGSWSSAVREDGLLVLDWSAEGVATDVLEARFEIHQGLLVAIRARLEASHPAAGDPSWADDDVLYRNQSESGEVVQVLWITKNCPVHLSEVQSYTE